MIFYATIGAIAVGIVLALLILQYVKKNSITIYISRSTIKTRKTMNQEFNIGDKVRITDWPWDTASRTIKEIRKTTTPLGWFCVVDFEETGAGSGIIDSSGFTNMIKIDE